MMGVEPIQDTLQFNEVICCDRIAPYNIAEVQEGHQALDHFQRYMAGDSSKIDLMYANMNTENRICFQQPVLAFMSALESSPVHCEKSRPFENH